MGQYHLVVNLDKKEFIHPHEMGDGLKLLEFGSSGDGGVMSALAALLATSSRDGGRGGGDFCADVDPPLVGSWAGDRIAIIGDYAEHDDLPSAYDAEGIYRRCSIAKWPDDPGALDEDGDPITADGWVDISPRLRSLMSANLGVLYDDSTGWRRRFYPEDETEVRPRMAPDTVISKEA